MAAAGGEPERLASVTLVDVTAERVRLTNRSAMLANDAIDRLTGAIAETTSR